MYAYFFLLFPGQDIFDTGTFIISLWIIGSDRSHIRATFPVRSPGCFPVITFL